MVQQKENQGVLIPQYNKEGNFLGYAIKKEGGFVQRDDKKGRLVIGPNDKGFEPQSNEECPEGYIIRYKGSVWKVSEDQFSMHYSPKVSYIPRVKDAQFIGYDVKQGGGIIGCLKPEEVSYEDNKSGGKNVFWVDGKGQKRFIENISQGKFKERIGKLNQTLSKYGEKYDSNSEKNRNIENITSKLKYCIYIH